MKFTVENIVELNITQNFESLLFRTVDEYCTILFELRSGPEIEVQHGPSTTFHQHDNDWHRKQVPVTSYWQGPRRQVQQRREASMLELADNQF